MPHRISPDVLDHDRTALLAILAMSGYSAANPDQSKAALEQLAHELTIAEEDEKRARQALEAARDRAVDVGQRFHASMQGARAQVLALFGNDSTAISAVGRKKKSERKRPARRTAS